MKFINDCISDMDSLGYSPYIAAFEYLISKQENLIDLPIVFGIHGKWGVGKSTFMNLVKNRLDNNELITIDINPWELGSDLNFTMIFLVKLYDAIKDELAPNEKDEESFITSLFKSLVKPLSISGVIGAVKAEYDFSKLNVSSKRTIVDEFISENLAIKDSIKKLLMAEVFDYKKIVVFIDDLDRCRTKKVIEVIESIKLILNSEKCIFILGCDNEYLENALSIEYKDYIIFSQDDSLGDKEVSLNRLSSRSIKNFSREYLEKIIQVPFYIPPLDQNSISKYIDCIIIGKDNQENKVNIDSRKDYYIEFKKDIDGNFIKQLVLKGNLNPRKIKRVLNLSFLNYLFVIFKDEKIEQKTRKIFFNLLFFFGFLRDVIPEYYKIYLSNPWYCKIVFKEHFEVFGLKAKDDENEKKEYLQNQRINELFIKFFELSNMNEAQL